MHKPMRSVIQLTQLPLDIERLADESRLQGFRILERLVSEYEAKENCFDQPDEALFAVQQAGITLAVGGVNRWWVDDHTVLGRVRRVYVSDAVRGEGVGSLLMGGIEAWCQGRYSKLVLFTNTESASRFYESMGFEQAHAQYARSARVSHAKTLVPEVNPATQV